jgi:hypothetical protein
MHHSIQIAIFLGPPPSKPTTKDNLNKIDVEYIKDNKSAFD